MDVRVIEHLAFQSRFPVKYLKVGSRIANSRQSSLLASTYLATCASEFGHLEPSDLRIECMWVWAFEPTTSFMGSDLLVPGKFLGLHTLNTTRSQRLASNPGHVP